MRWQYRKGFWLGVALIMVLASLDWWNWFLPPTMGWLGFPSWLFYVVVLHGVLVLVIWQLRRTLWQREMEQ